MKLWEKIWPVLLVLGVLGAIFGVSAYSGSHKTREEILHQQDLINNHVERNDFNGNGIADYLEKEYLGLAKPVIYLYPEKETQVSVKLDCKGELTFTYPDYQGGWQVTALPDGTLYDNREGREYSYLFWEGVSPGEYDFSHGFVVKGEDTRKFLQEKLAFLGLTPREYNEFIVYWLPQMQNNPYNLIAFQKEAYTELAKLEITPRPDSLLRVFMAYQPLEEPVEIEPQQLEPFVREGFAVVEWGGSLVE